MDEKVDNAVKIEGGGKKGEQWSRKWSIGKEKREGQSKSGDG